MRLVRPWILAPVLFREALFRMNTAGKVLCLTFDDGPDPVSTPVMLKLIEEHNVRALFFTTGRSAEENPALMERIRSAGHLIGNHGYDHLNGFRTPVNRYIENVTAAARLTSSAIFRPPYGKITLSQYRILSHSYKIVFWDVMPYDFDPDIGMEQSLNILRKKSREGSIIVLHDTPRSSAPFFLEKFFDFAFREGYRFEVPSAFIQKS